MPHTEVYILYTGGTIGMVPREPTNAASPLVPGSSDSLQDHLPFERLRVQGIELALTGLYELDGETPIAPIDSADVTSHHWRCMAAQIGRVYEKYDGFVILHGTDTMAYTASALSFMLANQAKPVVITGSQLPLSDPRSDATSNFVNAVHVAGHRAVGLPLIPEVVLAFARVILRGNRARKMSSTAWQGFDSPNCPHLGDIGERIRISVDQIRPVTDNEEAPFYVRTDLEPNIADLSLFPGIQHSQISAILGAASLRGAVLRTYGAGNAPSDVALLDVIEAAVRAGKVIVNVTQCPQGMVEAGLYESSSNLLERGVISGMDMTPEAALTKLMTLLANEPAPDVPALMQIDQRGEQTESLFDVRFGGSSSGVRMGGGVMVTSRPAGPFRAADLDRAVLRLHEVHVSGLSLGDRFEVNVFINHPSATMATDNLDPRHAARLEMIVGEKSSVLADVTATARRVMELGRAVSLTLVPDTGDLEFESASLAMLSR